MLTTPSVLLEHLYSYFAALLGCSQFGATYKPYKGDASMYKVHKFMYLDEKQFGWFITNVGLSAASYGVTKEDVDTVAKALMDAFGYQCSKPAAVVPPNVKALQAICTRVSCLSLSTCSRRSFRGKLTDVCHSLLALLRRTVIVTFTRTLWTPCIEVMEIGREQVQVVALFTGRSF